MNPCLQHALLVYDTDDAFAARAVGHLDAGIEADHSVLAVTTGEKRAILRDALGSRSARVAFVDSDEVYTRPEAVLAHYDSTLRSLLRHGAPGITVYGELPVRETPEEWDAWISYEAILNRSFADRPASVVCGYDARAVPGEVLVKVYEAHPYVFTDKHRECPVYREPEEIVGDLAPAALPLPPMRTVPFADDREFKERLAFELAVARVPRNRAREMLVAAVEVLSNANYHGNGARHAARGPRRRPVRVRGVGLRRGARRSARRLRAAATGRARRSRSLGGAPAHVAPRVRALTRRALRQALVRNSGPSSARSGSLSRSGASAAWCQYG